MALILVGFVYFVYLEKHKEYVKLEQTKSSRLAKLQEDRSIADNLPKFKSEYESMKRKLDKALAELPNQKEIPNLLTSIASLAKDNGLDVLQFKPGGEKPQGFYAEVPVSLKLVGSYHEVAMFAYDVSNMARIVNINNLKMDAPKMVPAETCCLSSAWRPPSALSRAVLHPRRKRKENDDAVSFLALVSLLACLALSGCGEKLLSAAKSEQGESGRQEAGSAAKKPPEAEKSEPKYVYEAAGRRDPFLPLMRFVSRCQKMASR
ncbi:MAG: type 4a pilus biogenesis protein PilO [Syntrophotaleaceae bacterium]